ncbi:hypothetical protein HYW66_02125 [Candidatus Microgenomates bacterium]|nr:hypothetical protein [Candidatus Microgenomates bacterium]
MQVKVILGGLIVAAVVLTIILLNQGGTSVTQDVAVRQVKNLPEVMQYLKSVPNGQVLVDHEDKETGSYVIQVFEVKNGHTATFNWFLVDKKTGQVKLL